MLIDQAVGVPQVTAFGIKQEPRPRLLGHKGRWLEMPTAMREDLDIGLTGSSDMTLRRFDNVHISQFVYPRRACDIVHTVTFKGEVPGVGGLLFRVEDPHSVGAFKYRRARDAGPTKEEDLRLRTLHPFNDNHLFLSTSARFPGFDTHAHYTIWAFERPVEDNSPAGRMRGATSVFVVVQALITSINKHSLRLVAGDEANRAFTDRFNQASAFSIEERLAFTEGIDAAAVKDVMMRTLLSESPALRILRCPLLFYLWPQSELMSIRWKSFVKLANALENGTVPLVSFCFQWMMPEGAERLTPLNTERLRLVQFLLDCKEGGTLEEANGSVATPLQEQVLVEFCQNAFDACKNAGHTYTNKATLYAHYLENIATRHARFTIKTILNVPADAPAMTATDVKNAIEGHAVWKFGQQHHVLRLAAENLFTPFAPGITPVVYAGDDWAKQWQFQRFLINMMSKRWNRTIHASGCHTENDVVRRIKDAQEGRDKRFYRPHEPRFNNPGFLREFAKLDDHQKRAVYRAVLQSVTIIAGRPGTGKTQVFRALFHLFGGNELAGVVPMAAYGRIAAMLRDRLDGAGHTFHRASATCLFRKESEEAQRMIGASTGLWDEGGLITHHHACMFAAVMSKHVARLVIAGDPDQMDAIGSGGFFHSLVNRFKHEKGTPRYTHLLIPHRFLTKGQTLRDARDSKGSEIMPLVNADMAIDWNMRVIANRLRSQETNLLNLAYTTDVTQRDARFVLTSSPHTNFNWVRTLIEAQLGHAGRSERGSAKATLFHSKSIQFITQRHTDCKSINRAVYASLFDVDLSENAPEPALRIGERVSFVKNGYFVTGEASAPMVSDAELERLTNAMAEAGAGTDDGALDPADYVLGGIPGLANEPSGAVTAEEKPVEKRKKRDRTDTNRGVDSDDVFNGEIKMIARIADVDSTTGEVLNDFQSVSEGANAPATSSLSNALYQERNAASNADDTSNQVQRGKFKGQKKVARLLIFDDDTQLNITNDYEADKVIRSYCITSKKMQGSQASIVNNYLTPNLKPDTDKVIASTIYRSELYTNMTRAERQFVCIVPIFSKIKRDMLMAIEEVVQNVDPPHNNSFAAKLPDAFPTD